jgi:hypothetical protein
LNIKIARLKIQDKEQQKKQQDEGEEIFFPHP